MLTECATLGGCPTGEARITRGYLLRARWVIHTVGPVWHGGFGREPELLRRCYASAVALAAARGLRSLAFPCISAGAYGYPPEAAAPVAVAAVRAAVAQPPSLELVRFVCFRAGDLEIYRELLGS